MRRLLMFFLMISTLFLWTSHVFAADFSGMKKAGSGQVGAVIDPQTIQLIDGRLINIMGLDMPYVFARDDREGLSQVAVKILKDLLEGKRVNLYQSQSNNSELNRMGHWMMQVERSDDNQWVQGLLLSLGLARVRTTVQHPDMAEQMYKMEKLARKEEIGVWRSPDFTVYPVELAPKAIGQFAIIEGVIEATTLKNNRVYLNFGKDWKTDFTVSLDSATRRLFSKKNVDPLQFGKRKVRVRGWVEDYYGPSIQINHPEALEILEKENKGDALPPLPESFADP